MGIGTEQNISAKSIVSQDSPVTERVEEVITKISGTGSRAHVCFCL